jgi:hypothetical protein
MPRERTSALRADLICSIDRLTSAVPQLADTFQHFRLKALGPIELLPAVGVPTRSCDATSLTGR